MQKVVAAGHRLAIVDVTNSYYRSPDILFRWIAAYMLEGLDLYYIIRSDLYVAKSCIYEGAQEICPSEGATTTSSFSGG